MERPIPRWYTAKLLQASQSALRWFIYGKWWLTDSELVQMLLQNMHYQTRFVFPAVASLLPSLNSFEPG